jgi:uncharacterized protein DUF222/HNH endonuclease
VAGWARLAAVDPQALSDTALLDHVAQLSTVVDAMSAELTRAIGVAHRRGAAGYDGAVSTQAWLRQRLRRGDAAAHLRAAAVIDRVPEVATAYARGEIGLGHVDVVARVLPDLSTQALAAGAGKLLAEQAAAGPPRVLARAAVRIRDHFHPAAGDDRARRLHERRWLSVARTFEGAVAVQGLLDPDGGELLLATLGNLMPPAALDDGRTAAIRRADALIDMCRLAGAAAPVAGGEKPHVSVTVDWRTLSGEATSLPTGALPAGAGGWLGATLGDRTPITATTARRLACDATILPAVLGTAGEVLDLGRTARLVTPPLRRALVLRDGGCRFPTCDRPPEWTDAHHLHSWAAGGPTSLPNLILLCRHHHVRVHEGGWRIRLDPDTNTVTVTRPDGRPHHTIGRPRSQSP